ncbi:thiamine diphosphate-binding protein [Colletotrichum cereale]|nr:thiamine diphosphate-binding protein [Colletotrichum cereale]
MSDLQVAQYLFRRLKSIGIETVFGVPGDYELALLDFVPEEGLNWIGTPNELVGAYAADGYARQKGAGALVTTFGPGELSALCGIGGSFCENVPVLHIVGYPTRLAQASGEILHHTLGDLSYEHYRKMSAELSCATTVLQDAHSAPSEIDRVLNAMMYHSKPGYIGISEDVALAKIPTSYLESKIVTHLPPGNAEVEDMVITKIMEKLSSAKTPIIVVDGGAARGSWEKEVSGLIDALKLPCFNTILGKGIIDESNPLYHGQYAGIGSAPNTIELVESADCVLWLGNLPSDFNTGMFSEHLSDSVTVIDFQRFIVKIGEAAYEAKITQLLPRLSEAVKSKLHLQNRGVEAQSSKRPKLPQPTTIEQDWLWDRFSSFLQPGDLVVTETGTAQIGFAQTTLPTGSHAWTQAVYGSIGYAAGAAAGASVAAKEMGTYKRMVLITGEGSLQLTVQAFAILNRYGIPPIVFILNNDGYTVERYFNGMDAAYNQVPKWDYCALFKAFSPGLETKTFKVESSMELDALLSNKEFQTAMYPQCVEMIMDAKDLPTTLRDVFRAKAKEVKAATRSQ